jgi:hypothetical protein
LIAKGIYCRTCLGARDRLRKRRRRRSEPKCISTKTNGTRLFQTRVPSRGFMTTIVIWDFVGRNLNLVVWR